MTQRHETRDVESVGGKTLGLARGMGPSRFPGEITETSARSGQEVLGCFSEREVPSLGLL